MTVPKHVIVRTLRERGQGSRADWVERELPDEVDTHKHSSLLATLKISAEDLAGQA
ncbi:hypothetical protein [Winogradskya humida]|uniref:Uncharacterized protein n=1 Tax=Winogradskya humida TaxID=113566 RepID=A0ABQ3ZF13_9ACTN|nr:hypothetical protein [Actinoplanes humidus]GIE17164.1 hypothetical protein Ahu01nite_002660 [Actinoplanes humidus]